MPVGPPFTINFRDRLNLSICNTYNAKTSFLPFQASHFGIKNQSKHHVFSYPLLGPHFAYFISILFPTIVDLGTPSKSRGRQNPSTPASVRRCQISECRIWQEPELNEPNWIIKDSYKLPFGPALSPKIWFVCFGCPTFASTQKHKKTSLPKSIKISKNHTLAPNASILMTFWRHFDLHFRSIFLTTQIS